MGWHQQQGAGSSPSVSLFRRQSSDVSRWLCRQRCKAEGPAFGSVRTQHKTSQPTGVGIGLSSHRAVAGGADHAHHANGTCGPRIHLQEFTEGRYAGDAHITAASEQEDIPYMPFVPPRRIAPLGRRHRPGRSVMRVSCRRVGSHVGVIPCRTKPLKYVTCQAMSDHRGREPFSKCLMRHGITDL